jgi:hypothetical protein
MSTSLTFTLGEASQVLDPPVSERQLRQIVTALGWKPDGWRRTGHRGHPFPTYDATELLRLHAALVPFLH